MTTTKSWIILAVVILAGLSIYFIYPKKAAIPQTPSGIISAFYNSYQDCLKNPPQEASGQVSVYCQNHTGLTTADFSMNIDVGGIAALGADPIVCAQNLPQDVSVSNVTLNNDAATTIVKELFGTASLDVRVNLKKIENGWKLDNIQCPRPDPAADPGITDTWATYANENSGLSFKYPTSAGSNFSPSVKTTATGTRVDFQSIGLEFSFVIQPVKPGMPKYFENSIFQESNQIASRNWDVSLSADPAFVAYQTTKNNVRYIFVFPHETEKNQLQQTIISTFKFTDGEGKTVTAKIGAKVSALGVTITPEQVLEDSRCPQDVQCIQAGTVRLKSALQAGMGEASQVFILGKTVTTETEEITLTEVLPVPKAGKTIKPSDYQFTFSIKKRI